MGGSGQPTWRLFKIWDTTESARKIIGRLMGGFMGIFVGRVRSESINQISKDY
ncbi:MAG: hypothetical protein ACI8V2_002533 [Candidatus Latescibacterota bacterium]|jgi:hypothetical protein